MKKSIQTLMTAAVFAAALGTGVGDTISAQFSAGADDVTTVPQTTYGPPVWMMTTDETEEEIEPIRPDGEAPVYSDETTGTTGMRMRAGDEPMRGISRSSAMPMR